MRAIRDSLRLPSALVPVVFLLAATGAGAQERYELSGDRVAVYNLAGEVEVVAGAGDAVTVEVVRGGDDAEAIRVGVQDVRGRQALVLRYPDDEVVYPAWGRRGSTTLRVRGDGTFYGGVRGGDRVRVRASGSGMEAWADLRITVPAGRDLALFAAVGSVGVEGTTGALLVDMGAGDAVVRDVRGMVEVDTGSGDVRMAGVEGEVVVDTGSGDIRIDDVRGAAVTVDTGSGLVAGSGIAAGSLAVDTGSGDVRLDGVEARAMTVDTGSGDVSLALVTSPERVRLDTGSGDVVLRVAAALDAELEVDTGSGRIDADMAMDVIRRDRRTLHARLGGGRGRIVIDTGSGDITLRGG